MNHWINFSALWRIIGIGLLAGAGLPAIFALGVRALADVADIPAEATDDHQIIGGSPWGKAIAGLCFAVVLAAIGYGIYLIVDAG